MSDPLIVEAQLAARDRAIKRLEARVEQLEGALGVCRQFRLEVAHAMECGPGWYTRGEDGLRQQIRMWIDRAGKALQALGEKDICDHTWSDPSINAPPVTCEKCGVAKEQALGERDAPKGSPDAWIPRR